MRGTVRTASSAYAGRDFAQTRLQFRLKADKVGGSFWLPRRYAPICQGGHWEQSRHDGRLMIHGVVSMLVCMQILRAKSTWAPSIHDLPTVRLGLFTRSTALGDDFGDHRFGGNF